MSVRPSNVAWSTSSIDQVQQVAKKNNTSPHAASEAFGEGMLSFITSTAAAVSANAWVHDWSTTASSTFADFNSNTLLTDAQERRAEVEHA